MANITSQAMISTENGNFAGPYATPSMVLYDGVTDASQGVFYATGSNAALVFSFTVPQTISQIIVYVARGSNPNTNGLQLYSDNILVNEIINLNAGWETQQYASWQTNQSITGTVFKILYTGIPAFTITEIEIISAVEKLRLDMAREIIGPLRVDSARKIIGPLRVDLARKIAIEINDTMRTDTSRRISGHIVNAKSFSLSLAAKTLTDTFSIQTYTPIELGQYINGQIKDFPYNFVAEETTYDEESGLQNIVGKYDIDEKLNTDVFYSIWGDANSFFPGAAQIMQALIKSLNKEAVINIDNFYPSSLNFSIGISGGMYVATSKDQGSMSDVINTMFLWTSEIPHQLVNVFERGETFYILQRGKESATVILDEIECSRPTISKKKLRTISSSTSTTTTSTIGGDTELEYEDKETYLSGTFTYGDATVKYSNGLVTEEEHKNNTTSYEYSSSRPPAYLNKKTMATEEKTLVTEYFYNDGNLVREEETEYDSDETVLTQRITRHTPLGQGFWGVSVEVDGEIASTSIERGNPGAPASPYTLRTQSKVFPPTRPEASIPGRAKGEITYNVCDLYTVHRISAAIIWLDGKTEERVNITYYGDNIVDFLKTVTFRGNVYYLEVNRITQDTSNFSQQLELVRWY